eukprot:GHVT01092783.1.p1 GENE.GHVT01092783.1~~GHVT01092783.1.p1  ORF type:complete len:139 (-),score=13.26 GHVT01092783.1:306-722(-)
MEFHLFARCLAPQAAPISNQLRIKGGGAQCRSKLIAAQPFNGLPTREAAGTIIAPEGSRSLQAMDQLESREGKALANEGTGVTRRSRSIRFAFSGAPTARLLGHPLQIVFYRFPTSQLEASFGRGENEGPGEKRQQTS